MRRVLAWVARNGRAGLVAGLAGGVLLPDLAQALRPWLGELVAGLLFLTALRVGPKAALGGLSDLRRSAGLIALYQLALPLLAYGVLAPLGLAGTPAGIVLLLLLASPSVTGSANFAILLGHDPAPAMRLLVLGTALLPLTVLPVLWLSPALGDPAAVILASLRLAAVIGATAGAGFVLRRVLLPEPTLADMRALDGLSVIALAVVVIGLMSAVAPALARAPWTLAAWLAFAMAVNFGFQMVAWLSVARALPEAQRVPVSIVAGNRNVALFLVALPEEVMAPLLIFIGCYQIPMYLTPILLRGLYGQLRSA